MTVLFQYPNDFHDDLSVWVEEAGEYKFYYISVEGCICYQSLQSGIDYLTKLKEAYFKWLNDNGYKASPYEPSEPVYKTYAIEIYKSSHGFDICTDSYSSIDIYKTYEWLEGVISQLDGVKCSMK